MAKKSIIEREKKRIRLFQKYESKRRELKQCLKNAQTITEKLEIQKKLQKLPRNSNPVRVHNRCQVTGRPKGYYKYFGLSRHLVRDLAHNGMLPGVRKASW